MAEDLVHDRYGIQYRVEFTEDKKLWTFALMLGTTRAGLARCGVENDQLRLRELVVYSSDSASPKSALSGALRWFNRQPQPPTITHFQGRGLGTLLIGVIVKQARAAKLGEVFGIVSKADLARDPGLPAWYERRGFTVTLVTGSDKVAASISLPLPKEQPPQSVTDFLLRLKSKVP